MRCGSVKFGNKGKKGSHAVVGQVLINGCFGLWFTIRSSLCKLLGKNASLNRDIRYVKE